MDGQSTTEVRHHLEVVYFGNQDGAMMNGVMVKLCLVCGALSGNTLLHACWHEENQNKSKPSA